MKYGWPILYFVFLFSPLRVSVLCMTSKFERYLKACPECGMECYSHPQYMAHKNCHLSCLICGYKGEELLMHIKSHEVGVYDACPLCNKGEMKNINKHIQDHFRIPFPCPYDGCNREYMQETSVTKHIKNAHLKVYDFKCEECGKLFAHSNNYEYHISSHPRKKAKEKAKNKAKHNQTTMTCALFCNACNKSFKRLFDYYSHLASFHSSNFLTIEQYKMQHVSRRRMVDHLEYLTTCHSTSKVQHRLHQEET